MGNRMRKHVNDPVSRPDRFALAIEGTHVGLWDWHVQTGELVIDARWAEICGYSLAELEPVSIATWERLAHPDDLSESAARLERHFKGETEFYEMECRIRHKDGRWIWVHDCGKVASWTEFGLPLRMTGTHADITRRKETEEEERKDRENLENLFNTIHDFIFVLDEEGRILHANKTAVRRLGYTLEELKGRSARDLHPESQQAQAGEILAAMLAGVAATCPIPLLTRDGETIAVETRITPGIWNGCPVLIGISRDISDRIERRQAEEQLTQNSILLSHLLDSIPDIVFFKDRLGTYLGCNPPFAEFVGQPRDEIIGKTDHDLFPHELADFFLLHDRLAIENNVARHNEEQVTYPGGRRAILDTFKAPLKNQAGEMIGLLGISRDVTDRKNAECQLRRISRIQAQLMRLATAFVNVTVTRQDEAIDDALESIGEMIGADRAYLFKYDFAGREMHNTHEWCAEGIDPEKDNLRHVPMELFPEWVEAHLTGESYHVPNVFDLPAGSNLRNILEPQGILSLITLPLIYESTCFGFVGFDAVKALRAWGVEEVGLLRVLAEMFANFESRRISEEMVQRLNAEQTALIVEMGKLQQNLVRARDEAQAALRSKGMFLANMSHEIRTPLNAILGYAQIINRSCRTALSENDRAGMDVIMTSGQHLLQLINDLLMLARNENQVIELNKNAFDFHALVTEVGAIFSQKRLSADIAIEAKCLSGVPQVLYSDLGKIRQVLINLVGNAVKFTSSGYIRISASAIAPALPEEDSAAEGVTIAVRVEDTGKGIPSDQLDRIFMAFEQAKSGFDAKEGSGLGLTISRQYARALGGDVTAESEEGRGSIFLFTFKANFVRGDFILENGRIAALAPGQPARRLLLVEDDPDSLAMLSTMLGLIGFEVQAARSGAEALEMLVQPAPFDAVLMDRKMPGLDGTETMQIMRSMPQGRHLPILIVSASGLDDEEGEVRRLGADAFVPKPVQESRLLAEIKRVTGVRYLYEQAPASRHEAEQGEIDLAESIATLPAHLMESFRLALHRGSAKNLRALAGEMKAHHSALAARIYALVERYDYAALEQLFNPNHRNAHEPRP